MTVVVAAIAGLVSALPASAEMGAARYGGDVGGATVATTIRADEWRAYRSRFIAPSGRVVDIENGRISHSEGQGYGLLLAVHADDRRTFERVLGFTLRTMRRDDALISWIYDPRAHPPVRDTNNATDGDILIAFALLKAAVKWDAPQYVATATPIIEAIGEELLRRRRGFVTVRPAAFGFDARHHPDGPVLNLSYYVYGAFLLFRAVDDSYPWLEAWQSGLMLTEAVTDGQRHAPDWVTLRRGRFLEPAAGFPPRSSYDAVRIPLYMALGGRVPRSYFMPFDRAWNIEGNGAPKDVDLDAGRKVMDMNDAGYRAIAALTACVARGVRIPRALQRYRNTTYFSSSLHLLALSAARANHPRCVDETPPGKVLVAEHFERGMARLRARR